VYEDTDTEAQAQTAALILLIHRGDTAAIERQEKTLRQTTEDRDRTHTDIINASETCYQLASRRG
jgi:hypothetical protein